MADRGIGDPSVESATSPPANATMTSLPTPEAVVSGASAATDQVNTPPPVLPIVFAVVASVLALGLVMAFLVQSYRRRHQCQHLAEPMSEDDSCDRNHAFKPCPSSPSRHRRGHSRTSSLHLELGMPEKRRPSSSAVVASAARRGVIMTRPDRARWRSSKMMMDSLLEEHGEEPVLTMESPALIDRNCSWSQQLPGAPSPAALSNSFRMYSSSSPTDNSYLLDCRASGQAPWSSSGSSNKLRLGSTKAASLLSRTLSFIHAPPESKVIIAPEEVIDGPGQSFTYRFPSVRPGSVGSVESVKNMSYRVDLRGDRAKSSLRVMNA